MVTTLRIDVQKSALIDVHGLPSALLDAIHSIVAAFMITIRIGVQKSALIDAQGLPSAQLNVVPIKIRP